ncbi:MAG: hypothetical protein Q4B48_05530 [Syntrophomonadaceae bacterium]|nr:hypothetical protein [Syntrophomonadaceae bacterium]
MKRAVILIIVILCALGSLTACNRIVSPPEPILTPEPAVQKTAEEIAAEHAKLLAEIEYEPYATIDELKADAELIFVGTVTKVTAPVDMVLFYIGDNSDTPFYYAHTVTEIEVEQVIKGDIRAGDTVSIRQPGATEVSEFFMTNEVLLTPGARGLFFTADNSFTPNIPPATLRYEQGVFRITEDTIEPNFVQDNLMESWLLGDVLEYLSGAGAAPPPPPVVVAEDPKREHKTALGVLDSDYSVYNAFWIDENNVLIALSKTLPENGLYVEYGQLLLLNTENLSQQIVYLEPMSVNWSDFLLYDQRRFVYQGSTQLIFMDEQLTVQKVMDDRIGEHQLRLSPDLQKTAQVINGVLYITSAVDGGILAQYEGDGFGLVWAPDSAQIAFLSSDQRSVIWMGGEQFSQMRVLTLGQGIPHSENLTALTGCAFTNDSAHLVLMGQDQHQVKMLLCDITGTTGQVVALAPDVRLVKADAREIWYLNNGVEYSLMHYENASGNSLELYRTQWPILAAACDDADQSIFIVEYEQNQQQMYLIDVSGIGTATEPEPAAAPEAEAAEGQTETEVAEPAEPAAEAEEPAPPPEAAEEDESQTPPPEETAPPAAIPDHG